MTSHMEYQTTKVYSALIASNLLECRWYQLEFYKIRPLIRALIIIMDERLPDGIANFKRQPVRLVLLERQLD